MTAGWRTSIVLVMLTAPAVEVAYADIYVWSDRSGVSHFTNRPENVSVEEREHMTRVVAERPRLAPPGESTIEGEAPQSRPRKAEPAKELPEPGEAREILSRDEERQLFRPREPRAAEHREADERDGGGSRAGPLRDSGDQEHAEGQAR